MIELRQRGDIQDTLNEMLNISLMRISLARQMEKILSLALNISWLALDKKGCIVLTDASGEGLDMIAHQNMNDSLLGLCKNIQFGQCLCGRAALQQTLIFRDCVDDEIVPAGMSPHGHYNMPIISNGDTLGVLNLYVAHGHKQSALMIGFLNATAKTMASIIERKKIEEKLHKLSYEDELTGIANRRQFMEHLDILITDYDDHKGLFALLFVDLDRFKQINDTYGHEYGDELLIQAAQRMGCCLRDTDFIARIGGDEFVITLNLISEPEDALLVAKQLIKVVSAEYRVKNKTLNISASIGISVHPTHDDDASGLLKKADIALYQTKEQRGDVILFSLN